MYEAIPRGDDQTPWNLRVSGTYIIWNAGSCLTDQFQIAEGGIICQVVLNEAFLIQSISVSKHFSEKPIMSSM